MSFICILIHTYCCSGRTSASKDQHAWHCSTTGCAGENSCGPLRPFFYAMLCVNLVLMAVWLSIIVVCCWKRARDGAEAAATVEAAEAEMSSRQALVAIQMRSDWHTPVPPRLPVASTYIPRDV